MIESNDDIMIKENLAFSKEFINSTQKHNQQDTI